MMRKITIAVINMHKHGLTHRDLKLLNILVDDNLYDPHIIDLGVSGFSNDLISKMGTEIYMPPEYENKPNKKKYNKVDIYSLGIIFYEIL